MRQRSFIGRALAGASRTAFVLAMGAVLLPSVGCDNDAGAPAEGPDARLKTHEVQSSRPSAEGLAYVRAIAAAHRAADGTTGQGRVSALRAGLAEPVPANLPEAEILRLETATRLAEVLLDSGGDALTSGAVVATDLLGPMLAPERSLPLDRSTARALVVLGDAAAKTGDDALAAGSYARAIRMMSILRQELEQ